MKEKEPSAMCSHVKSYTKNGEKVVIVLWTQKSQVCLNSYICKISKIYPIPKHFKLLKCVTSLNMSTFQMCQSS